jgi:hypothetical protein
LTWFLKFLNLLVSFLAHFFKFKNFRAQFRNQEIKLRSIYTLHTLQCYRFNEHKFL